ncbi:peptide transporter family 1 [Diachasma alloeum]|uniref:peptide transporter family 1 n=1 Tax=Diachasma alloeum TaxID=454923 RepID=UPI0007382F73|nr:peptide transporter family 1 [Diachasma alloeum]
MKGELTYPKAVFLIICMEFCERFSFHGMRIILSLYIKNKLNYSDDTATIIYHAFMMLAFFFPLFGAILADSILGKFKTILYLSVVYAAGQLLLAVGAVPTFGLPVRELTMIGLFLIATGTGGIKPCVSALGGDQFILPEQENYFRTFFPVFYFAICSGAFCSSVVTPELRNGIKCFEEQECYSIAFFVPTILMVLTIVIFLAGKPLYRIKKPARNIVLDVAKCIWRAIHRKSKANQEIKQKHWLDYANDKYDSKFINDLKKTSRTLKLFIAFPFFWALSSQVGSRWTFQATRMNGEIGSFLLKADQIQVVEPIFAIILVPALSTFVYPVMAKIKCLHTPLQKLTTGGILGAVAFIFAALVELRLETTYPVLPTNGSAQLRIFNPRDCQLPVVIGNESIVMEPFAMWGGSNINIKGNQSIPYIADFSCCGGDKNVNGFITAVEGQATSYVLESTSPYAYKDYINKTKSGNPAIRVLTYNVRNPNTSTKVELSGVNYVFESASDLERVTPVGEFIPGEYNVKVNGKDVGSISIKLGGVYTLQTFVGANMTKIGLSIVTPPNSVHILWLLPQYVAMTLAEVVFSTTGYEFAFTQAPSTMKSLLQAVWLLTIAGGNLIVVIITKAGIFKRQALEFSFFAGSTALIFVIFAVMTKSYEYHNYSDDEISGDEDKKIPRTGKNSEARSCSRNEESLEL